MDEITEEPVQVAARVCAIDIGKAGLVVCVRVPHTGLCQRFVQPVAERLKAGLVRQMPARRHRLGNEPDDAVAGPVAVLLIEQRHDLWVPKPGLVALTSLFARAAPR
jgi:hypothetical protein